MTVWLGRNYLGRLVIFRSRLNNGNKLFHGFSGRLKSTGFLKQECTLGRILGTAKYQ
ncbi:hypothetical protein [Neisseria arctica]|nr:hypothetical protein [Neisseria arctica]UOO85849.1 hypothetical protein LVJ86_06290 [Neisseria arctica]